jgi:hypothetical protein
MVAMEVRRQQIVNLLHASHLGGSEDALGVPVVRSSIGGVDQ